MAPSSGVITNRKEPRRLGLVQLIDATAIKTPLRKNLGEKNCETSPSDRQRILDLLMRFEETPESKIFPNEEFGYWELSVERPLRLRIYPEADLSESKLNAKEQEACRRAIEAVPDTTPLDDWDAYAKALGKMPKNLLKKLRDCITTIDPSCKPVSGEADKNLSDTEQVPLSYEGGIEAFMQQEVLPYAPDAYVAETKIGYELSFTKYFYKPQELRSLADITTDIRAIEAETDGLLAQILDL